jgi:ethanolamine kinase
MCRHVNAFAVMAHAFWGTWALIQAKYSPIDFDFLAYAGDRFGGYRLHHGKFIA